MKALDVAADSSSSSSTASKPTFLACDIKSHAHLLRDRFYKLGSNFELNSTFKIPNVKSYDLLKEDFYVNISFLLLLLLLFSR